MRLTSWMKPKPAQLDLLSAVSPSEAIAPTHDVQVPATAPAPHGKPLMLPVALLREDPNNPRTEFPEAELDELADDIGQRGILGPMVVHPVDAQGCNLPKYAAEQHAGDADFERPLLYLHGRNDGVFPARLAALAENALGPRGKLLFVEDAGHFLQLQQPKKVNDLVLDWLRS
jgi:pimeloyl-ACP methyl ester carboxylesterase